MNLPHDTIDPDGLLEYSVVFTDRSLNHMSQRFVGVMQQLLEILREAYDAQSAAIVPGGGSYAMEAVARQLADQQKVLVVRNGLFSYRWSQIFETAGNASEVLVAAARAESDAPQAAFAPAPIEEVAALIREQRPAVVFAPHVETAAGIQLTDEYISALSQAVHEVGGVMVLDCIASGASWVSMKDTGVDVLISAPQKGWSGTPCAGYVMFSEAGAAKVQETASSSFALDLKKWLFISDEYVAGRAPYHATMPTDSLAHNAELMEEARQIGLDKLKAAQIELGAKARALMAERGFASVAAAEFAAPSVVVSYTDDEGIRTGAAFKEVGVQIAAGVPLHCGEPADFSTFRLGLFGLDKLGDVDGTVARLRDALDRVAAK
ncbi:class V aminotransferase [Glutamicibacter uratoxydans]|uniref:Class V aminotransferase n=1 Tax=Glutamicibacter uratoxydans TaxID=43667 RepID=A0A4Y4DLD9_GLUUR|nr:alanine--glyoxylate aminotransferase family protein [Glutamicibacter uratoxydans]GED05413.1 class V aminotransferase [Glutamicibacter uratoxydans]